MRNIDSRTKPVTHNRFKARPFLTIKSAPLTEALAKTFDGRHPCSLCKMVAEGKRSERKQEAQPTVARLELFFTPGRFTIYPPSLDPRKVKLTDKIAALPAFDPTGTMTALTFANPIYWAQNADAWQKQWDRISKGA